MDDIQLNPGAGGDKSRRDFGWLLEAHDWHGCRLPEHAVVEAAARWGISESGVRTWFRRRLDRIEGLRPATSLAEVPALGDVLALVGQAPDGVSGYRLLQEFGAAPATQRLFYIWMLLSPLYPELRSLADREMLTINLQARGLGRRACRECRP